MTSLSTTSAAEQTAVPDLRRASRVLAAVLLPIGPALIAALRFVLPYETNQSDTRIVREIAAHQGAANAIVWLGFAACLVMVPTVLWVGRIAARRSPRLTAVALCLLVPGYASLAFLVSSDAVALYAAKHGFSTATAADLYTSMHPTVLVAGVLFVVGHVLGTILLGVALLRGGELPAWAGWAIVLAQPLHAFAAVVVGSHPLDLVAWGLNAVGFAVVSSVILRTSDDEWAPRPVERAGRRSAGAKG